MDIQEFGDKLAGVGGMSGRIGSPGTDEPERKSIKAL